MKESLKNKPEALTTDHSQEMERTSDSCNEHVVNINITMLRSKHGNPSSSFRYSMVTAMEM